MSVATTVVISAAGLGTRLGLNKPKVLVEIAGQPLLAHHLDMLDEVEDVVIVAGYMAQEVISVVRDLRPDVAVALNHQFTTTGTAASLVRGSRVSAEQVVSLDGDLLVAREDFYRLFNTAGPCLGLTQTSSEEPVCAVLDADSDKVVDLSQEWRSELEWSGLVKASREDVETFGSAHVFHGVRRFLPMAYTLVDCVEVDHPSDITRAETWLANRNGGDDG